MMRVKDWDDLGRALPGICDGHVRLDECDAVTASWRGWLDEFNETLPASIVTHIVLVAKGLTTQMIDSVDRLLIEVQQNRRVRLLVDERIDASVLRDWPVVGTVVDNPDDLQGLLSRLSGHSARVVYIDSPAVVDSILPDLREAIVSHTDTRFVFARLGGQHWRFTWLLAEKSGNVFFDTSHLSSRPLRTLFANRYQLARVMHELRDRLMFATGFPSVEPLKLIAALTPWVGDATMASAIFRDNALRMYFDA